MSKTLARCGINVYRQSVVGDNPGRLKNAFSEALSRSDLVLCSGGLGPTCDDITKETAADFMGLRLVMHAPSREWIERYFKERGRQMPESNLKQALIPEGAVVFENKNGTAPGVAITNAKGDKTIILLPGPPRELIPMLGGPVSDYLSERTEYMLYSLNINLTGIGESLAESMLRELMNSSNNPTLAPYAYQGYVRLRITAKAKTKEECALMCEEMLARIKETPVAAYITGDNIGSPAAALVATLRKAKKTVSFAESCTGGLVSKLVVDIPGASGVFPGGAVVYSEGAKENVLGVKADTVAEYGVVSAETAEEMALCVRKLYKTDIGASVTGVAGPGGGSVKNPVGTVWLGIADEKGTFAKKLFLPGASREEIREKAATELIFSVLAAIRK